MRRVTSAPQKRDPVTSLTRLTRRRRGRLLAASAGAALMAVTAVTASGCASSSAISTSNNDPGMVLINTSKYKGNIVASVAKPSGTLMADDGKAFNVLTETKGIVTLLYFGYTDCPDLCPLTMSNTSVAIRMLPKADQSKVLVLFVSVDPYRDTLARLRSWLGKFDPAFIGLRGTLTQVQAFEQQTGLPIGPVFKDGAGQVQLDHATEMFAYGTDNVAHEAFFPSTAPAAIANDLKLLVAGGVPS
jgi:protein SCO1